MSEKIYDNFDVVLDDGSYKNSSNCFGLEEIIGLGVAGVTNNFIKMQQLMSIVYNIDFEGNTCDDAVDLVMFAFKNGKNGDIFVQKAPAATIELLANTLKKLLNRPQHIVKIIGTRHGEKLYETLLTREEMVNAIDMDKYYRIPSDTRDLNYNQFFEDGEVITEAEDYHSHNTHRLDESQMRKMLLSLKEIEKDLIEFEVK